MRSPRTGETYALRVSRRRAGLSGLICRAAPDPGCADGEQRLLNSGVSQSRRLGP